MPLPTHLSLRVAACLSVTLLLAGCSSSNARARDALNDYQAAAAANDTLAPRPRCLSSFEQKMTCPIIGPSLASSSHPWAIIVTPIMRSASLRARPEQCRRVALGD